MESETHLQDINTSRKASLSTKRNNNDNNRPPTNLRIPIITIQSSDTNVSMKKLQSVKIQRQLDTPT